MYFQNKLTFDGKINVYGAFFLLKSLYEIA